MTHFISASRNCLEFDGPGSALQRKATAALIAVLAFASITAGARASSDMPLNPASDQRAQTGQICATVIGIRPGQEHFDGCVKSLQDSLQSASHDRAVLQARIACFRQGLKPNSADLSLCLLQAADAPSDPHPMDQQIGPNPKTLGTDDPNSSGSYFSMSFDAVYHREQQACANLGFDPAYGAFANCVSNLQDTLQKSEIPTN